MYSPVPRCSPRVVAWCKLPSALRPGLSQESIERTKEMAKEDDK